VDGETIEHPRQQPRGEGYVIVYIQATFVKQISHLRLGVMA